MHESEWDELQQCVDCGSEVAPGTDRAFAFGDVVLCFDCAVRRGGEFDAQRETWSKAPSLGDISA
jgi:hypothetical protein